MLMNPAQVMAYDGGDGDVRGQEASVGDIRDYLEWRGDVTLAERPFNDVDNVIMATLSYLDLTGIAPAPGEGTRTLRACLEELLERAGDDLAPYVRSLATVDLRFVRALAASERFGNAAVRDYVDEVDAEKVLQFAALTVDLDDGCSLVSFRGTDSTLVGWQEDFMLSFTVMESQVEALRYLTVELETAAAEGQRVYVCGHSKGGVLATYAAVSVPERLRPLIARVWSDDGPCMDDEVVAARPSEVFGDRFAHVVPAYDVVGTLFDDGCPRVVVESSAEGALQHDPMTWQVEPAGLVLADGLDPESVRLAQAIHAWVDQIPLEERARFTEEFFGVLQAGGATTLDEVTGSVGGAQKVLAALSDADQRTKDLVGALFAGLVGAQFDSTYQRWSAGIAEAASAAAEAATASLGDLLGRGEG